MKSLIEKLGITFYEGFDSKNIGDADVVVVGNATLPSNSEAILLRDNHIPSLSLPEALYEYFIKDKRSLVVAWHARKNDDDRTYRTHTRTRRALTFIPHRGRAEQSEHGFKVGAGNYFVIEGDEYDSAYFDKRPKFLHYAPTSAIITSIEFDHLDIYRDMEDYRQAFTYFADLIPESGTLLVWGDSQETRAFANKTTVLTYGIGASNDVTCTDRHIEAGMQVADLLYNGTKMGTFKTPLPGDHNLNNVLAVFVDCLPGLSFEEISSGVASYAGMKRRQEVVYDRNQVTVVDDFSRNIPLK